MAYVHVKAWRKRIKQLLIQSFGDACGACGYSGCAEALEFHHLDPRVKDLGISTWSSAASFAKLAAEAGKCVMLCANCHREVHADVRVLAADIRRFDAALFGRLREAARRARRATATQVRVQTSQNRKRGTWAGVDVLRLREEGASWAVIGRMAGVSYTAARRRHASLLSGTVSGNV